MAKQTENHPPSQITVAASESGQVIVAMKLEDEDPKQLPRLFRLQFSPTQARGLARDLRDYAQLAESLKKKGQIGSGH